MSRQIVPAPPACIRSGVGYELNSSWGSLNARYYGLYDSFQLKKWPTKSEFPLARRVSAVYDMRRAMLDFGKLGTGEYALRFKFVLPPQVRRSSLQCCGRLGNRASANTLTVVFKSSQELHRWVRSVRLLFAGTDHHPCREGTLGGDECTICLDQFQDKEKISFLPCKHRFHTECITEWLARGTFCPNCKQTATYPDGEWAVEPGRFLAKKDEPSPPNT
jgi:hypothetical protein